HYICWRSASLCCIDGFIDTTCLCRNHCHVIWRTTGGIRGEEIITQAKLLGIAPIDGDIRLSILIKGMWLESVHFSLINSRYSRSRAMIIIVCHRIGFSGQGMAVSPRVLPKEVIKRMIFHHDDHYM